MLPSGECPCRIALAAAMVDDFEKKRKNSTKTQFLSSFLMVDQCKKVSKPDTQGPFTHTLGTTSPNRNSYATSQAEE
jgi:hypothetical protein